MNDESDGGYSGSTHMDSDTDPDVPWPPPGRRRRHNAGTGTIYRLPVIRQDEQRTPRARVHRTRRSRRKHRQRAADSNEADTLRRALLFVVLTLAVKHVFQICRLI